MNSKKSFFWTIGVFSVMLLLLVSAECMAQEEEQWTRAGRMEAFGLFDYSWLTVDAIFFESTLSNYAGGVGLGYNVNDYLNVNAELSGGVLEISGQRIDEVTSFALDLNVEWNILGAKYPVTPLASIGVGAGLWDLEIEDDHHSLGTLRASIGLGVRWDVNDNIFVKAVYEPLATEYRGAGPVLQRAGVRVGYMF